MALYSHVSAQEIQWFRSFYCTFLTYSSYLAYVMLKEKVVVVVGGVDAGFKTKDKEKSINSNKGNGKPSVSCFPKCIFSSPFDCCSVQDVYSL